MKYSPYQETIFNKVREGISSIIVNAVAGSGKTTTIVAILEFLTGFKVAFVAFNKHVATELQKRLPNSNGFIGTTHSLGLKACKRAFPRTKVQISKVWDMLGGNPLFDNKQGNVNRFAVSKLLSLVRNTMTDYRDIEALRDLCLKYDVCFAKVGEGDSKEDITDTLLSAIPSFMEEIINSSKYVIDFDDMLFLPAMGLANCEQFDVILVDEVQDYNRAQVLLTEKSVKPGGRVVAVGDRRQAIYGFRGADSNAMDYLQQRFNAIELPLSISYRCPVSHVQLAQSIVAEIQHADTAKQGEIINIKGDDMATVLPNDALVIARRNAPLIPYCLKLLKAGRKAIVKGKDIGKNLVQLIKGLEAKSVVDLMDKVDAWRVQELAKYVKKPDMQEQVNDKAACVDAFCQDCATVNDVIGKIESVFSDDSVRAITLSTVHRAKGLESNYVAILEPGKLGAKDKLEELNIAYVAYTRSMHTLAMVD